SDDQGRWRSLAPLECGCRLLLSDFLRLDGDAVMKTGRISRRVDSAALMRAPFAAMQWRLLLLWVLLLLLPTAVVSLPIWRALSSVLDHSIHAQEWAARFNGSMFSDVMTALNMSNWFGGIALLGM